MNPGAVAAESVLVSFDGALDTGSAQNVDSLRFHFCRTVEVSRVRVES